KDGDRIFLGSNKGGVSKEHPFELTEEDLAYISTFSLVHCISSSVCLSRSPLILLAVNAGFINISIKNSMDETKVYSSKKREYCISAVTLTCSTTVN
ncbi:hypothetical protein NE556_24200, partial [[Clostridium] symbiosum]|nr:hypothetical protein [[Clostridium] symbiosum]